MSDSAGVPTTLFSIDLDDLWCSAGGYSFRKDSYLLEAIETTLEYFAEYQIKGTFFCIAKDRKKLKDAVSLIQREGHEIANHSTMHRYNQGLSLRQKTRDIDYSTKVLEDLTGAKILGYRAPGWGQDEETCNLLREKGYLYDSSVARSPLFPLLRLYHMLAQRKVTYIFGSLAENLGFFRRGGLAEIDLGSVRLLPFYGSFHLYFPFGERFFHYQTAAALPNRVSYIFHAFDFALSRREISGIAKRSNHEDLLHRILATLSQGRRVPTHAGYLLDQKKAAGSIV